MNNDEIKSILFDRYIKNTINNNNNFIGTELELPILNLSREAVSFPIVHHVMTDFIKHFRFTVCATDDNGDIISAQHSATGDIISFDCSYNNLEFSFGRETNIFAIDERFRQYYTFWQSALSSHNYTLTGMGVNPYRIYNHNVPIPNGRYRMLFHHLKSYKKYFNLPMYFHRYPEYGTFSSASQVQLDFNYDTLPKAINVFSRLEPIKALLFSNSVLIDEQEDVLCCRDLFWEYSTHGVNSHNIGMYDCEFANTDEILSYIATTSIYCAERDGKYINFPPTRIIDYMNAESIEGEYYDNDSGEYKPIELKPQPQDIEYLRTFKFEDLTYRGTVEFRSVCCQPVRDSMTVAAFHAGARESLDELRSLLYSDDVLYGNGYTSLELRKLFINKSFPSFLDEDKVYKLTEDVLDIIAHGLRKRGLGEEAFLEPLYRRAESRSNPAKAMLEQRDSGTPLEEIIRDYSML